MLGHAMTASGKGRKEGPSGTVVPEDLQRRLAGWIDVEQLGADGLWLWLREVLPLLPNPEGAPSVPSPPGDPAPEQVRQLQRRLIDHARDRTRLAVICEQYARDNQVLARRLTALEASLREIEREGGRVEIPDLAGGAGPVLRRGGRARTGSRRSRTPASGRATDRTSSDGPS